MKNVEQILADSHGIISQIQTLIKTGEGSVYIPMQPIWEFEKVLDYIGFDTSKTNRETNGWEVDFWYSYTHPEFGRFVLAGSLYSGDFKFSKKK